MNLRGGEEEITPGGCAAEEEVLHVRVGWPQVAFEIGLELLHDGRPYGIEQRRPLRRVPLHYFFNQAVGLWARQLLGAVEAVGARARRAAAVMTPNGELHFVMPAAAFPARGWDAL